MDTLEIVRSFRRSKHRRAVLLRLAAVEEAYPMELAEAVGVEVKRIRGILHGEIPYYAEELALVSLMLAAPVERPHGIAYRILPRGREIAARIAIEKDRAAKRRLAGLETELERGLASCT